MSEMGSTPEEALRLTDNELLENWYVWHVAEHTRGAGDPREPPRTEEFLAKLERCAKMIAIEAILYSEEEINIFMNTLEAEGNAEGDPQTLQAQAVPSVPDDDEAVANVATADYGLHPLVLKILAHLRAAPVAGRKACCVHPRAVDRVGALQTIRAPRAASGKGARVVRPDKAHVVHHALVL